MNALAPMRSAPDGGWAARITACWRLSVESVLEVGGLLTQAKATLPHGEFGTMIERELPFTSRTAQMLMAIFADPRLSNPKHVSYLPPSWGTLYELTKLTDDQFETSLSDGTIRPDMERRDIGQGFKQEHRAARERELGENQRALPTKKYGVIYADPEWRFEPYSRDTGMDRSADNHYPTSTTDAICARPVQDIAADDCVLFLCATAPMLPDALRVMAAWGFAYKSHAIWRKDRIGNGYWFRNQHELLLVGTRGNIPAPAMGTQFSSVIYAPVGKHSEKPDAVYELIEAYFPNLPKIELNARRARPGWESWGNEAPENNDPERVVFDSISIPLAPAALDTVIGKHGETSGGDHDAPPDDHDGGASTSFNSCGDRESGVIDNPPPHAVRSQQGLATPDTVSTVGGNISAANTAAVGNVAKPEGDPKGAQCVSHPDLPQEAVDLLAFPFTAPDRSILNTVSIKPGEAERAIPDGAQPNSNPGCAPSFCDDDDLAIPEFLRRTRDAA